MNLQYLSIAHCPNFSDKGLAYFGRGKGGKKLIYVDMSGCPQVNRIAYRLCLDIGFYFMIFLQITIEGFAALCQGCAEIQHWVLDDNPGLDDSFIKVSDQ